MLTFNTFSLPNKTQSSILPKSCCLRGYFWYYFCGINTMINSAGLWKHFKTGVHNCWQNRVNLSQDFNHKIKCAWWEKPLKYTYLNSQVSVFNRTNITNIITPRKSRMFSKFPLTNLAKSVPIQACRIYQVWCTTKWSISPLSAEWVIPFATQDYAHLIHLGCFPKDKLSSSTWCIISVLWAQANI